MLGSEPKVSGLSIVALPTPEAKVLISNWLATLVALPAVRQMYTKGRHPIPPPGGSGDEIPQLDIKTFASKRFTF